MTEVPYNAVYRLKDQTPVEIRLVCPQDRELLLTGFARLSTQSNIDRFLTYKKRFTDNELDYLLKIDNINHLAIGAVDVSQRQEEGIGIARYVRRMEQPDQAEVGIVVIDAYQGRGLGRILYTELMKQAYENNIEEFINLVGKDNLAMQHLLRSLNATKQPGPAHAYEYRVKLATVLSRLKRAN
jgi:ribosomal protein S18 acetylase RimI-like enzyme